MMGGNDKPQDEFFYSFNLDFACQTDFLRFARELDLSSCVA
jgi:hypothetical protein